MIGMRARARSAGGEVALSGPEPAEDSVEVQVPKRAAEHDEKDAHPAGG